ncbi:hypothetical protein [Aestuariivirga sp.]|uniref:hypothetical protein n=1 Tax=Aestuariivirga sp. TaxID=2650926 RepID=UPI0039E51FD7
MNLVMRKRLEAVLEAYGADPARWPVADRQALIPLLQEIRPLAEDARRMDQILALATRPMPSADFEDRLMARIEEPSAAIVPLPGKRTQVPEQGWSLGWIATIPLAASLALGIYFGAHGTLDRLFPSLVTGNVASADDDGGVSGLDDTLDLNVGQT